MFSLEHLDLIAKARYYAEKVDGCLVLYRDSEEEPTERCPFCGDTHQHGVGDGHRVSHCSDGIGIEKGSYILGRKAVFKNKHNEIFDCEDGYVIKTRS